jgi:hypothetical protein
MADFQGDTAMYWARHGLELTKEGFSLPHLVAATTTVSGWAGRLGRRLRSSVFCVVKPVFITCDANSLLAGIDVSTCDVS